MHLPRLGTTYAESYGFMTHNPEGFWLLDQIDPDGKRALFVNLSDGSKHQWKYGTILPDGRITTVSVRPYVRYIRVEERLIPTKGGDVMIEGEFPDFRTTQGLRVWLDFDRSMTTYPVDFASRLETYRRKLARAHRAKERHEKNRISMSIRPTKRTITRLFEGGYSWRVEMDSRTGSGVADTKVKAEMAARAFERRPFCQAPGCENSLEGKSRRAKFCSNACRMRYHRGGLDNSTQ